MTAVVMINGYRIRALTRADRVTLSKMIEKAATKIITPDLLGLVTATAAAANDKSEKKVDPSVKAKLTIEIVKLLTQFLNEDLTDWFASLLDVSVEEFNKMPFNIEIEILKQLQEADEVTDFFTGASQQFSEILSLGMQSKIKKTK